MLVHEHLAACFLHGFHHTLVGGTGNALVALAMVVGAYVEDGMVFAVVPADVFCFGLEEREEVAALFAEGLPLSICAKSQLREMTAWAFRNSREEVAFISDEMTLVR